MIPVFIYGTRPEANKLAPILREMTGPYRLICTGQHKELLVGSGIRDPDLTLECDATHPMLWANGMVHLLEEHLGGLKSLLNEDLMVIVQGDTSSVGAGAMAAKAVGAQLAHVEAGVRSHGIEPWPEEPIRKMVTGLADWHFAASTRQMGHLLEEGIKGNHIFVHGNPGITQLMHVLQQTPTEPLPPKTKPFVLVTLHRRELRERPDVAEILQKLFRAFASLPEYQFVWPVHPGWQDVTMAPNFPPNLRLSAPLGHRRLLQYLQSAKAVLTDSGGLTEEAAFFGAPTVIFRNWNDRQETVEAGIATLCPHEGDIHQHLHQAVRRVNVPRLWYGDADTGRVIAQEIMRLCSEPASSSAPSS